MTLIIVWNYNIYQCVTSDMMTWTCTLIGSFLP